jgi:hypothetical protein
MTEHKDDEYDKKVRSMSVIYRWSYTIFHSFLYVFILYFYHNPSLHSSVRWRCWWYLLWLNSSLIMVLCVEEYPDEVGKNEGEDVQATRAADDKRF